eukprot:6188605-Pleurochrysis_carterae.AAC.1
MHYPKVANHAMRRMRRCNQAHYDTYTFCLLHWHCQHAVNVIATRLHRWVVQPSAADSHTLR